MKLIGAIVGVLMFIIAGALVVAAALDSQWEVSRTQAIDAAPSAVYQKVASPKMWSTWSTWNIKNYPAMTAEFDGPDIGVGAIQRWHDGSMAGETIITEAIVNKHIAYDLTMDGGQHRMQCVFILAAQTELTWRCQGYSDGLLDKLMIRMFAPTMGQDFEIGLNNLKQLLES